MKGFKRPKVVRAFRRVQVRYMLLGHEEAHDFMLEMDQAFYRGLLGRAKRDDCSFEEAVCIAVGVMLYERFEQGQCSMPLFVRHESGAFWARKEIVGDGA